MKLFDLSFVIRQFISSENSEMKMNVRVTNETSNLLKIDYLSSFSFVLGEDNDFTFNLDDHGIAFANATFLSVFIEDLDVLQRPKNDVSFKITIGAIEMISSAFFASKLTLPSDLTINTVTVPAPTTGQPDRQAKLVIVVGHKAAA